MVKRSTRVIPQGIARASPGWKFLSAASGKFGLLLVALVALILLSPLLIQNERWVAATGLCSAAVLVAGLQDIGGHPRFSSTGEWVAPAAHRPLPLIMSP